MSGESTDQSTMPAAEVLPAKRRLAPPWQKGQSGNPSGANVAIYHEVRRLASAVAPDCMKKLIALCDSRDDRVAFMALQAVIERGAGKPRDHADEDALANRLNLGALSPDERALLTKLLQKVAGT